MSYIKESSAPGEREIARFPLHWSAQLWLWISAILTLVTFGIAAPLLIVEWLRLRGIEMGVTNRRAIHKRGILGRNTQEMRIDAIETVEIVQSAMGRLLGRGTVRVTGRGNSDVVFPALADPMQAKRDIETATMLR